jgi:hypothetical protein
MSKFLSAPIVKRVKSAISLRSNKSTTDLKQDASPIPIQQESITSTTALLRLVDDLLDTIEQIEKEAAEGIPILKRKKETPGIPESQDEVKTLLTTHQEAAYYDLLHDDYFNDECNTAN